MSLFAALRYRLGVLLRPEEYARELKEEMDFHLSLDAMQEQVTATDATARRDAPYAARRRFGNVTHYSEETRQMNGLGFFDMARQDVRFALRTFRQAPGFTAVAVLTIALGLGATTAIFSVVNGVVLQPLPYPAADRVVMVWMDNRRQGNHEDFHSFPNLSDLAAQNRSLDHVAAYGEAAFNLTGAGEPERVFAGSLPAEAFAALGVGPVIGRLYTADNERTGNDAVVLLGHGFWQTQFAGDPNVVGRQLELNGRKRTVIGVMPPTFTFPASRDQFWVPLVIGPQMRAARQAFAYPAIARLKPGVSLARARADLSAIASRLATQFPDNRDYGVTLTPMPEQIVGPTLRTTLWISVAAVAAVLLIACANVANLLLSRAAVREREVTVRLALGASNGRLVRQLLTESVLLALMGGALGVVLAVAGLRVLRSLAPADLPRVENIALDPAVLLATLSVTLLTGLIFGLVPALRSSRAPLSETLRDASRGGTSGRAGMRLRRTIVGAQLALVVVLLTGAGLLVRTFVALQRVDLGFDSRNAVSMNVQLPGSKYPQPALAAAFYENMLERVRAIPGVKSAATVSALLLSKTPNSGGITAEGRTPLPADNEVTYDQASTGFFETIGATLVAGRQFNAGDRDGSMPVAIINSWMAKYYWPNANAVGKRFHYGPPQVDSTNNPWLTVVGVIGDMRRTGVDMPVREEAFVPYAQDRTLGNTLIVRTAADPLSVVPRIRELVRGIDKDQPVSNVRTLDDLLSGRVAQRRFSMTLVGAFAALALLLAVIGAYGVTSYLVSQRTREIGVRLALGADASSVTRLVVLGGMRVAVAGVLAGVIIAAFATRLATSLLYGVSPRDPLTIGSVAAFMLGVVALANYLPARRAARVDPLTALRQD